MRTINQKVTVTEKRVCYSQFPRGDGTPGCAGLPGEATGLVVRQRTGKTWARAFITVSVGEEWVRQGK